MRPRFKGNIPLMLLNQGRSLPELVKRVGKQALQ